MAIRQPSIVSHSRKIGATGSAVAMEVLKRAEQVMPMTLSAYSLGAAAAAKPSASAAHTAIGQPDPKSSNGIVARAAPITVPTRRLSVRTYTEAYSGRTTTATVRGNQKECAGSCRSSVVPVAIVMQMARRSPASNDWADVEPASVAPHLARYRDGCERVSSTLEDGPGAADVGSWATAPDACAVADVRYRAWSRAASTVSVAGGTPPR